MPAKQPVGRYYYQFSWIQLLRPMTLSGTISPIGAGTAFIFLQAGTIQIQPFLLLLIGAILIQMATNIWNDYFDFRKGQDKGKWQTNADNKHHPAHHQLPYIAIALTTAAIVFGMWLAVITTFWVIPVGISGIIGGFYYSAGSHSLSQIGLGELTAALFLGFVTTLLPFLCQGVYLLPDMFLIAIPFALLISTMILTNNIRDIEKDREFRSTIAILLKRKKSILLLKILLVFIYGWTLLLILLGIIPMSAILILTGLPIIYKWLHSFKGTKTNPACMKYAAWHHWVFGLSFIAALMFTTSIM